MEAAYPLSITGAVAIVAPDASMRAMLVTPSAAKPTMRAPFEKGEKVDDWSLGRREGGSHVVADGFTSV